MRTMSYDRFSTSVTRSNDSKAAVTYDGRGHDGRRGGPDGELGALDQLPDRQPLRLLRACDVDLVHASDPERELAPEQRQLPELFRHHPAPLPELRVLRGDARARRRVEEELGVFLDRLSRPVSHAIHSTSPHILTHRVRRDDDARGPLRLVPQLRERTPVRLRTLPQVRQQRILPELQVLLDLRRPLVVEVGGADDEVRARLELELVLGCAHRQPVRARDRDATNRAHDVP